MEQSIIIDILSAQEALGSDLLYYIEDNTLVAVSLDSDGNETDRYRVGVSLEKF